MKKFLIALFLMFIVTSAYAIPPMPGGGGGVIISTDCSTYIALGQLCQETDDGKLYKGTGTAAVEIAAGSSGDMATAMYDADSDGHVDDAELLKVKSVAGYLQAVGVSAGATREKTVRDANDTLLELGGSYTPTGTWNFTSLIGTWPTFNQNTTGTAAALTSNGANCAAGQLPLGVDASGAAEGCTATPSLQALTLTGANTLSLGTASTNTGSAIFKNATNANAFTITSGVSSAAIGWTLPTAAPGGANYLLNVDADGTMGYTDPLTLGGSSLPADAAGFLENDGAGNLSWGAGAAHDALTLAGTPETNVFTLTSQALSLDTQNANYIFAGPATGDPAAPTFRAIVDADIPDTITVSNYLALAGGTMTGNITLDDGTTDSPSIIFKDATDETATLTKTDAGFLGITTTAGDGVNILVGNLKVGNGTPTQTQDGEHVYIEGMLEVDGAIYADGGIVSAASATPYLMLQDTAGANGKISVNANDADDARMDLAVDDSTGSDTSYMQLDGVSETVDILKPATFASTITTTGNIELGNASDTTLARVSGGVVSVEGVNVVTTSSSDTLTNKTFDANGTGNTLKGYGYITFTKPHNRGSATAAVGTTETTQLYGVPAFADDVEANNYVDYIAEVPRDIDTAVDLVAYFKFRLGGADTGDHDYIISMVSIADSAAAAGTPANAVNLSYTADGNGADGDIETATGTLTDWKSNVTAGNYWLIRVTRDGDDGTDDASTVDSYPMSLTIRYGFTQ